MPGVFKTVIFDLAAKPDLGRIWTSQSFGIAIDKPVGTKQEVPGPYFIGLFIKAIKSTPDEPSVL